mmetsp:Transcript_11194/g.25475  ORF Transcript_11194/g.25475 Transcript_11194/m.25475 type:complete len:88 (+) Transcript_11194:560-823(+)
MRGGCCARQAMHGAKFRGEVHMSPNGEVLAPAASTSSASVPRNSAVWDLRHDVADVRLQQNRPVMEEPTMRSSKRLASKDCTPTIIR